MIVEPVAESLSRGTANDALMDPFYPRPLCAQARVGLGDLREEHLSRQGFAGPVAMLYRTDGPNEVVRIEGDYRRGRSTAPMSLPPTQQIRAADLAGVRPNVG
jgi:hypothetical protein